MWSSTRWRVERLCLALTLCLCAPLMASTVAPDARSASPGLPAAGSAPGTAHPVLAGSRLQGQATLRFFGMQVYEARLWTLPNVQIDTITSAPLVLELHYLRALRGPAIAERSLKEMRRAADFNETQAQRWLAALQRIIPDVKAGDRLTGLHQPGQGVRFWHNGQPAGEVPDAQFARLFFGIWLAPVTSEPDMRLALLGQAGTGER